MILRALADLGALLLPPSCFLCGARIAMDSPALVCVSCSSRLLPPPAPLCRRCGAPVLPEGHPLRPVKSPGAPGSPCPPSGSTPRGPSDRAADPGEEGCRECADWPVELVRVRAGVVLDAAAGRLVAGLKYRGWPGLAPAMARTMARAAVGLELPTPPVLVPIPTTPARRRVRGYNQAGVLARALGAARGWPTWELLRRPGEGRSQVGLPPRYRLTNVQSAFEARPAAVSRSRGRRVVLVDDVLTTGATLAEAARALRGEGLETVAGLVFARALPGLDGLDDGFSKTL